MDTFLIAKILFSIFLIRCTSSSNIIAFLLFMYFSFRKNIKLPSRRNTISSRKRTHTYTKKFCLKSSFYFFIKLQTKTAAVSLLTCTIATFFYTNSLFFFAGIIRNIHKGLMIMAEAACIDSDLNTLRTQSSQSMELVIFLYTRST